MTFRRWDPIDDAVRLLGLDNNNCPAKKDIERAFRIAAKKYHPDGKNNRHSDPNALLFRQCLEARDLLLDHFHFHNKIGCTRRGQERQRPFTRPDGSRPNYGHTSTSNNNIRKNGNLIFAKGFPFHTLHLLTTKSKVCIKAATGVLVLAMGLYDGYTRYKNKPRQISAIDVAE
uniref:J domain-containing protein n=1 Tax=Pseudo-nitzschia australis TaxID=44445 RepID=A0A7S4EHY9_9STRA|mmetsp:Transcript_23123/g.50506  ORF Transcript_23123/g.50506 Transcript_23123/m.50506 type:complete len:173 (-) Transcript_23123:322-840(-)